MFHVHLERMHSAAFGWNILWILLSSLGLIFHLRSMFIDFLSGWLICCFSRVLNSPTIILLLSIYCFMFVNIFFINLSAPMLGAYVFTNAIFSSCIDILIVTDCLSWSLVTVFILKSIFSDRGTLSELSLSFYLQFFHPLTFNLCTMHSFIYL